MYNVLKEHIGYVADQRRLAAYRQAVAQAVRPGDVVADVGCGTGVLGLLCLQAGAGKVYAIDSTDAILVAEESFRRAGWAQQVQCLRGKSFEIELPERVDVLICDHVGYFGVDYALIDTLADARRRLLKPGGRIVPRRLTLQLAAIDDAQVWSQHLGWQDGAVPAEYHWLHSLSANHKIGARLAADSVLAAPVDLGDINLTQDQPDHLVWNVRLSADRAGQVHGLAGWFRCELADGVFMSNSPLAAEPINRPVAFLPLAEPLTVAAGDELQVRLGMRHTEHLTHWTVTHSPGGQRAAMSTWHGEWVDANGLALASPLRVPRRSARSEAETLVLGYCDSVRTLAEIEAAVLRDHPALMPSPRAIRQFVAQVIARHTR